MSVSWPALLSSNQITRAVPVPTLATDSVIARSPPSTLPVRSCSSGVALARTSRLFSSTSRSMVWPVCWAVRSDATDSARTEIASARSSQAIPLLW